MYMIKTIEWKEVAEYISRKITCRMMHWFLPRAGSKISEKKHFEYYYSGDLPVSDILWMETDFEAKEK